MRADSGSHIIRSTATPVLSLATCPAGVPPMAWSLSAICQRDAGEPARDHSESSNVFGPLNPLLVGNVDRIWPFRLLTNRQTAKDETGLLCHVSKRRCVDLSPLPPEHKQGPSHASILSMLHDDPASRTPIREDPTPTLAAEVDELQQGGEYQPYQSKFVQPVNPPAADSDTLGPGHHSRVELFALSECAADQEKAPPAVHQPLGLSTNVAALQVTNPPFETFRDNVGQFEPVLQREFMERLGTPATSDGMRFADVSQLFGGFQLLRTPAEVPDTAPEPSK